MARIEGVYQKWLRTIPKEKITTLSHKESMEIDMAISDAFCRKAKIARQKQRRSLYLLREHVLSFFNRNK